MIESLFKEPPQSRPTPIEAMLSTNTVRTDYIPAVEGMDDEHRACGTAVIRKKALRYESDDFFEGMFDYCDGNQGVARYQSSSLPHSVKVLASNLENPLTNVHRLAGRRPLTSAEKKAVAAQKLEVEKGAKCTSTPAFIDSAVYLLEAVAPDGFTVRLSSYKTPGCAGHLATIYVLDILRKKDVIRTFQLSQSHGAL
jgi:hypothetical protein